MCCGGCYKNIFTRIIILNIIIFAKKEFILLIVLINNNNSNNNCFNMIIKSFVQGSDLDCMEESFINDNTQFTQIVKKKRSNKNGYI